MTSKAARKLMTVLVFEDIAKYPAKQLILTGNITK